MPNRTRRKHIGPRIASEWLALLLVAVIAGAVALCLAAFNESLTSTVPVTLTSDRSGLVMEPYAKVKLRGIQVGRVETVAGVGDSVRLRLDIDSDQVANIPANVEARINAASLFGSKFVELIYPPHPSRQHLAAGAVLQSQNVAIEVNTVFQNLVDLIKHVDPAKLNSVLSALAEGVRGQGERIGQSITDTSEIVDALNPRTTLIGADARAAGGAADTYSAAAQHIIDTLSAVTTTSSTINSQSRQLDSVLTGVIGLSQAGINLLGPSKANLIAGFNTLETTTSLLMKYNPELTCMLVGADKADQAHVKSNGGGNGKALIMDAGLLFGDDPYRFPDNLPVNGAKGGPGGKPGCGSLPDVANNWPVRYLITNEGFGSGIDQRPNPGIGFPGYDNFFPVTKGIPQPPLLRYPGGPAPGPYPGTDGYAGPGPYGAPEYGPGGTPLFPGVPPAPPPGPTP